VHEIAYVTDQATATVSRFSTNDYRAGATAGCASPPSLVLVGLVPFEKAVLAEKNFGAITFPGVIELGAGVDLRG